MNVTAVVLAAGSGQRVGAGVPKQFLPLAGRPMLLLSLAVFEQSTEVESVIVALPAAGPEAPDLHDFSKVVARVPGGETRQASLAQALAHLPPESDTVMVHDAARPLVEHRLIEELLAALDATCDGVIPGIPLEDTIKKVDGDRMVEREVERSGIWRIQTPQLFRRPALEDALARAVDAGMQSTDCSQMLTAAGYRVRVVEGDPLNFKVTRAADLWLAERVLESRPEAAE